MSFSIDIEQLKYILEVESSIGSSVAYVESTNNIVNNLVIENTSPILSQSLEVSTSVSEVLEIVSKSQYAGSIMFADDIRGLDDYLSHFIDNYNIDCGEL